MGSGFFSYIYPVIQAIDPGHAILELVRPALDIFRSETFAPDMSLAMVLSAIILTLFFRFRRVGPACEALRIRSQFLKKCTSNSIFSDNFYEFDLLMKEEPFLDHGWTEFVETCLLRDPRLNADIEITVRPSDFINMNDAEYSGLNIKWFHGLSPVYVGVGLLFTFAGLVAALYFSSAAINAVINAAAAPDGGNHDADVQRALAQLLNTATFKFLTSIAGLGCSIGLAFWDRRWRSMIEHGFDDLCRELERCTVMVTPESIADRQYQKLSELTELLKRGRLVPESAAEPAAGARPAPDGAGVEPAVSLPALIDGAVGRVEAAVNSSARALAASFERTVAHHTLPVEPAPPQSASGGDAPQVAISPRDIEAALVSALERVLGPAMDRLVAAVTPAPPAPAPPASEIIPQEATPQEAEWLNPIVPAAALIEETITNSTLSVLASLSSLERAVTASLEANAPQAVAAALGRIDDTANRIETSVSTGARAILASLEQVVAQGLAPAVPEVPASLPETTGPDLPPLEEVAQEKQAQSALADAAARIEATIGAAAFDLKGIVSEVRGLKTGLSERLEAAITTGSHAIVSTLQHTLAARTEPPPPADNTVAAALGRIDDTANRIETSVTTGARAILASLEQVVAQGLVPVAPEVPAPLVEQSVPDLPPQEEQAQAALAVAAARIEAAIGAAIGTTSFELKGIVTEVRGLKTGLGERLDAFAAAIRSDSTQTATLIRNGFDQIAAHKESAGRELATAADEAVRHMEQRSSTAASLAVDSTEQILARIGAAIQQLSWPVERLTENFEQIEGRFATHLAAFDALARTTRETEQAMAASGRVLQNASAPLTRASTELASAMAVMTTGVQGSVQALLESQQAGQSLASGMAATCTQLQEIWARHETRFISVDESVARILASIIQHAEIHGEAIRNHVVAIDTHLSHAVGSLAANIEALQEMVSDLTEATSGAERLAAAITEKSGGQPAGHQG